MNEGARSAIFGVFVVAGRALTASQVIALAAPLGITATNVKSHLTRMVADGSLARTGPARRALYKPSGAQHDVVAAIRSRLNETHDAPWDGAWILLVLDGPDAAQARDSAHGALWFDGFRPIAPATFIRPAWPESWAIARAKRHGAMLFAGRPLGWDRSALSELYDLDELDAQARDIAQDLLKLKTERAPEASFAARLLAGGDVARFIAHDPRLPKEMWGRRTGLQRLRRAWRSFEAATARPSAAFISQVLGGKTTTWSEDR